MFFRIENVKYLYFKWFLKPINSLKYMKDFILYKSQYKLQKIIMLLLVMLQKTGQIKQTKKITEKTKI